MWSIQRLITYFQDSLEPFAVFPHGTLGDTHLSFLDLEPKVKVFIPVYELLEANGKSSMHVFKDGEFPDIPYETKGQEDN